MMYNGYARFIPACAGNTRTLRCIPRPEPVHPRVCGEHRHSPRASFSAAGSSPRVRGTPEGCSYSRSRWRFIPACAGNTKHGQNRAVAKPVHPRVCGEHGYAVVACGGCAGSSPRVRGTRYRDRWSRVRLRFIPACAGNTCDHARSLPPETVHPRVCGEHVSALRKMLARGGSSPRVRGTRDVGQGELDVGRFIPACAGNTARIKR